MRLMRGWGERTTGSEGASQISPGWATLGRGRRGLGCPGVSKDFRRELLDDFTDDNGLDDEGIADAAEHFRVSEWLIQTALVNRGKLSRDRLPR